MSDHQRFSIFIQRSKADSHHGKQNSYGQNLTKDCITKFMKMENYAQVDDVKHLKILN